ncbi:virulence-associated E family protein [Butyrivibrio sp. INlla16]|uniref:virulence-associated E family protein n=1 Tax=Butyrivibrio sp. INlla16 TaxID=1520807 RepID=UPI0008842E48|nr:virulence-associated E family protein [Butyrivibrio sp. INlla16]SDB45663.1 Virulence-associated protein E [Butyrivibrio sp. INlla16]
MENKTINNSNTQTPKDDAALKNAPVADTLESNRSSDTTLADVNTPDKEENHPLSVPEIRELLECTKGGRVKTTMDNCVIIFENDPVLKGAILHNNFNDRTEIVKDMGWNRSSTAITDTDMNFILYRFEKEYGIRNERDITKACDIVANNHCFHPVINLLESLAWDGQPRIANALHHFLGADQCDYASQAMQLFMMGAINRVYNPGSKFDYLLVLVGGQGAGKSTFFRFLAMEDDYFTDDVRDISDKRLYERLQGHWIIEMSEMLAVVRSQSVEELKSFLSRNTEIGRDLYERYPKHRPRQCIFGGTTNSIDFLPADSTGNRRFIPIQINAENAECHILDDEDASREYIRQMWAEALVIYKSGNYSLKFEKELSAYLDEHRQDFTAENTKVGIIEEFLEDQISKGNFFVCSLDLHYEALGNTSAPTRWETKELNDIMNSMPGWRKVQNPRHTALHNKQRGWEMIPADPSLETEGDFIPVPEQLELPFK